MFEISVGRLFAQPDAQPRLHEVLAFDRAARFVVDRHRGAGAGQVVETDDVALVRRAKQLIEALDASARKGGSIEYFSPRVSGLVVKANDKPID